MYEVVDYSMKNIATIYIIFLSAGLLLTPISNILITAFSKGTEKWR